MENQTKSVEKLNMHEEMRAFAPLSGKWKLEIMWLLNQRVYRFGELRKAISGITQHMLTAQLYNWKRRSGNPHRICRSTAESNMK